MNRSPNLTGSRSAPPGEMGGSPHRRESSALAAAALICFSAAILLFLLREVSAFHTLTGHVGSFLAFGADYLWEGQTALMLLVLLTPVIWLYYRSRSRILSLFIKCSLLFLFFLYSIVPLRWAQLGLIRSPESYPSTTPLDAVLILLISLGTLFYCWYSFREIPADMARFTEKGLALFYRWKETYFIGSLLLLCFAGTAIIAYTVLDHIPHVLDSIAQLFQAKIFLMGKLYLLPHPQKDFFDYAHIINDSRWYAQYPPGHSLLLALGLLLGAPWLIGPLAGTCSLGIFYLFVKNTYADRQTAYLSSLLLLFSPFFIFMSSSHMNHTSTLLFVLIFLYFFQRGLASYRPAHLLIAGLALGYAAAIRPLDALAVGFPFICYLMVRVKNREVSIRQAATFFSGILALLLLLLIYNQFTNGSPFSFGYQKKYQSLGFLGNVQGWQPVPHTLKGGMVNTSNNLIALNQYLFEWPVPSLIFIIALIFMLLSAPRRFHLWDYLGLAASALLVGSYFFYFHQDLIFGPRFYYSIIPFLIILTVRGFLALPQWLAGRGFYKGKITATLYLFLLMCILYSFVFTFPQLIKKYSHDYWWVTDKLHTLVKQQGISNAIVFIDCWHPPQTPTPRLIYYGSGFQFNSPQLTDDVIYALDLKERNSELMRAFPGRKYYRCNFFWDPSVEAW